MDPPFKLLFISNANCWLKYGMFKSPAAPEVCVQGEGCIYQWVEHVREALATGTEGADVSAGDACAASEVEAGGQLWCHEWNEDKTELKGLKRVMIAC